MHQAASSVDLSGKYEGLFSKRWVYVARNGQWAGSVGLLPVRRGAFAGRDEVRFDAHMEKISTQGCRGSGLGPFSEKQRILWFCI